MTELLLVRHGETDWNAQHRWQGHDDPPLNELGIRQARALADELTGERIDAIYSSDLRRAMMTAELLAERLGVAVQPLEQLREIDVGSWSGLTRAELDERHPEQIARHLASWGSGWEGGETPEQLSERVEAALIRIVAEHPAGRVLVVAHGGVVRAASAIALGIPFADFTRGHVVIANCAVARLAFRDGIFHSLD